MHRYIIKFKIDWSTLRKPIYRGPKGKTFSEWIRTFTGYLISKVQTQLQLLKYTHLLVFYQSEKLLQEMFMMQVKGENPQKIFKACSGTVKNEHHVAYYLLPYVVIQVLLDGSDDDRFEVGLLPLKLLAKLASSHQK